MTQEADPLEGLAAEKLCGKMAERYGVNSRDLLDTLKDTCFAVKQGDTPFSCTEMAAALVICEKYQLNPLTREIYVTRNPKTGLLLVIIPIDGYYKISNRDPNYDGAEFRYDMGPDGLAISVTCFVHVRGRKFPAAATEYMKECRRSSGPWDSHPNRMLRHKAFSQAARMAFGLSEIMDPDEASPLIDATALIDVHPVEVKPQSYLAEPTGLDQVTEPRQEQVKAPAAKGRMHVAQKAKAPVAQDEPKERQAGDQGPEPQPLTFQALWARWSTARVKLSQDQIVEARAAGPVEFINQKTDLVALIRVVEAAEGMAA